MLRVSGHCLIGLLLLGLQAQALLAQPGADRDITIGVLAYSGKQATIERWKATADYLGEQIPDYRFSIKPLTHQEFNHSLNKGQLDFLLTNPGHYVQLEVQYGAVRIVTFKSRFQQQSLTRFGSVIFVRKDSGIDRLADLKGKTLAAVSEKAFGGFQLAQKLLLDQGIDARRDLQPLWLGFPHSDIVKAVLDGRADAGTVRSGIIEKMAARGEIDLSRLRILRQQPDSRFPLLLSTRLYPEWPLARLPKTDDALAKQVALTLLQMPSDAAPARRSNGTGWTIPLDYREVHDLFRQLKLPPYQPAPIRISDLWRSDKTWFMLLFSVAIALLAAVIILFRNRRQLAASRQALADYRDQTEQTRDRQTTDLSETIRALQQDLHARADSEQRLNESCEALLGMYSNFLREDLSRRQRLQSILDSGRQYLGMEFAVLSRIEASSFTLCTVSPANETQSVPLSPSLARQALSQQQMIVQQQQDHWLYYIACPVVVSGQVRCLFEFSSHQHQAERISAASDDWPSDIESRVVMLLAQWIGHEMTLLEGEQLEQAQRAQLLQRMGNITPRETEVLRLVAQGESNKGIARILDISPKTVELHRSNLLRKTQANSSAELVKLAVLAGLTR